MSISGVLLVWKKQYLWLTLNEARHTVIEDLDVLGNAIQRIQDSYTNEKIRFIRLYSEDLSLHKVFLTNKHYAWHDQQGRQIQRWTNNERLEDWLLDFHHRFLLDNTIGLNLAGFSGLLLLLLSILGGLIWWPRRATLRLGVWPKSKQRGAFMRSHGNLAVVTMIPVLMIAISGVILVYPNQTNQILYPNAKIRWISFANRNSPFNVIGIQQTSEWNPSGHTSLHFHSSTAKLEKSIDALRQSHLKSFLNFNYPLHTGKLGLWYQLLLSLFGVALICTIVFALASYVKRP
jgi:uncharacterized iron-regulated membrane protein